MHYAGDLSYLPEHRAMACRILGTFVHLTDNYFEFPPDLSAYPGIRHLIMDFTHADMITSKGVRNLILLREKAEILGLDLIVVCGHERISKNLLDLSLDKLFRIVSSFNTIK